LNENVNDVMWNRSLFDMAVKTIDRVYGSVESGVRGGHLDHSEAEAAKSSLLFGEVAPSGNIPVTQIACPINRPPN
jgi:hypothetical protein